MKRRSILFILALCLGCTVQAQNAIQFRSADQVSCTQSDLHGFKATFAFSGIESRDYRVEENLFSIISMPNTVIGGNEGDPQIPVVNELLAVPFGANPTLRVTSYSTTDYRLADYGIAKLMPRQPSVRKDQNPDDLPFIYNEAAYQTRGLASQPRAICTVEGVMRGIQIGKMTLEPVSYDPVSNTLRVFNDIEVEVSFEGADVNATEEILVDTYSPYFDVIYSQMFNGRAVRDAYSEHPDLYTTPVKMLVITTATYANSTAFQEWLAWKTMKGIYVDVYTTAQTGTTAASIKSFIQTQYNQHHPTFLVIIGDTGDVTYSQNSSTTSKVTDLYYSSPDGDIFPDIFLSRMPVSSTTELANLLNKILTYEQYTMADPSYLDNVLLIAGHDGTWNPRVGQPTINYAADNYFNTAHGFNHVYKYLSSYSGCYNNMNTGIGFANYTAHGSETAWSNPSFTVSDANNLTNNDKYFWAMGNCCLAANWGYSGTCLAEALLRSANKGAFGYIGSCPETYWWEDYYFGVGATTVINTTPSMSQTQTGAYDAMFMEEAYNTLNAVPYIGNVAVTYAHANNYTSSVSDKYYWEAYHCLGDGSVMPYHVQPTANSVSHTNVFPMGLDTYEVSAVPGSYVAISKDGTLIGTALVGTTGTIDVPVTPVTTNGNVTVCVTAPQRIPYIASIPAVVLEGAFISVDSYTPETAHVGDNTDLSITFKNLGGDSTTGNTTVTLTSENPNVTINNGTNTFGELASHATTTVSGFQFSIASGVADETPIVLHYAAVNGNDTWEGNITITAIEAVLQYQEMVWDGGFTSGETITVGAKFKNTGHYQTTNAIITCSSTNSYVTISNPTISVGTLEIGQEVTSNFNITIASNCPENAQLPITFTMTADGGLSATGTGIVKNSCNLYFNLADSYGDGWNGAKLTVSFDDGTPSQELTIGNGGSANYILEVGNGVHVTLTWTSGSFDGECSFIVSYDEENDIIIYQKAVGTSLATGVIFAFDCNCNAATQTFVVTAVSENTDHGTVSGGGEFSFGQSCTVTATPAEGYYFAGWIQNGQIVSSDNPFTFLVNSNMELVAHFSEGILIGDGGSATSDYLPSYSYYNYALSQQIYTSAELGGAGIINAIAFYNDGEQRTRTYDFYLIHSNKNSFSSGHDWVSVTASDKVFSGSVTMGAGTWTIITLDTPFDYNGTSNLILVADDNSGRYDSSPHMACRVFNATNQAIYVYSDDTNYNPSSPSSISGTRVSVKNQLLLTKQPHSNTVQQTQALANGWNWFSSYLEIGGSEGLQLLEQALTSQGSSIHSQANGFVTCNNGLWDGSLNSFSLEQMYQINYLGNGSLTLTGVLAQPEDHPITLHHGWNWIGYPVNEDLDLSVALANYQPHDNDIIKARQSFSTYIEGYGWWGTLNTLHAGEGFMYQSMASGNTTLTYHVGTRTTMTEDTETHYWTAVSDNFASNANLMVSLDKAALPLSEDIEIGVFVDGECRGSAKLIYVKPIDRYMAFLTVFGDNGDDLRFKIRHNGVVYHAEEQVSYQENMVVGDVNAPFVLHVGQSESLVLFPNPVTKGNAIHIELPSMADPTGCSLEIYDVLGSLVRSERLLSDGAVGLSSPGVYLLKITDRDGNTYIGRLIVR